MRSKLITVATIVASVFLVAQMAAADQVQEQLRLMEQRMAEMEDRLQATSDELRSAKATVDEQQGLLSSAGLVENADEEEGLRSRVGNFLEMVDISGVVAASYNYRFIDHGDNNLAGGNVGYFRHPNSDTFAIDQVWFTVDKAPTEESRGGMHAEFVWGQTAASQGGSSTSGLLYTGYASYLAPIGNGVQIDAGKLATPLGAEVLQTNQNFNITQGLVFGLQPVTHVGVSAATDLADGVGFIFGVVNEVYSQTSISTDQDKAYYGQVSFGGDKWGLNVGGIVGRDSGLTNNNGTSGCNGADVCNTSVVDVVMSVDPSDNLSMWLNFDWARSFGENALAKGDAYGIAAAGRIALTDVMGYATRVEYVRSDGSYNRSRAGGGAGQYGEVFEWTNTIDYALTDDLKIRGEVRWDRNLTNNALFVSGSSSNGATTSRDDQLVGLAEMYYEF
jgi:hypothetical protein